MYLSTYSKKSIKIEFDTLKYIAALINSKFLQNHF